MKTIARRRQKRKCLDVDVILACRRHVLELAATTFRFGAHEREGGDCFGGVIRTDRRMLQRVAAQLLP
jgi:hypothetical protein